MGKTIVITGASSGIGLATARMAAERGVRVTQRVVRVARRVVRVTHGPAL